MGYYLFFFFQAEDGIRDYKVTGVQTCALPICPFAAGKTVRGRVAIPGHEHLKVEMQVERIEPERYFSYRWHPYPSDPTVDYSAEPMTLVEFTLEDAEGGGAPPSRLSSPGSIGSRSPAGPRRSA